MKMNEVFLEALQLVELAHDVNNVIKKLGTVKMSLSAAFNIVCEKSLSHEWTK